MEVAKKLHSVLGMGYIRAYHFFYFFNPSPVPDSFFILFAVM